ncbi:hypothetical protein ACIBAI_00035 [Streptomyces sp. NPDC051041]|uniref:hypothetical protein n=1 Tax=Streptomyces sp. NPDC051041 TaxID=3365640 RepID=UPI0037AFF390
MANENVPALLRPLDGELPAEARSLANSLRVLFNGLETSVRRYAVRRSRDAGAISRYLNGSRLPPWEFILELARDVAAHRGESIKDETLELLRNQYRAAVEARGNPASLLELTRQQLAEADRKAQQSAIQIRVLTEALQDRKTLLHDIELQLRELQHRDAIMELKLDRVTEERDGLLQQKAQLENEVTALRDELNRVGRRAEELEAECSSLEIKVAALEGPGEEESITGAMTVGMLEMVGFTRLVRRLEEADVVSIIERLRRLYQQVAAITGARFFHTRNSDVTFITSSASAGAETALLLTHSEAVKSVEQIEADGSYAEVRTGLAYGRVYSQAGIILGQTVSLAERLCAIAPKDGVLADQQLVEQLREEATLREEGAEGGRFQAMPMWQRPIRGLGVVQPWLLIRSPDGET